MMSRPWWRAEPAEIDRRLRRLRAVLQPLAAAIEAPRPVRVLDSGEPIAIALSVQAWARIDAALQDAEPYPCVARCGETLDTTTGEIRAAVFSLGHQDDAHFVVEAAGLAKTLKGRKGCGCNGAIAVLPGAARHEWWLPPDMLQPGEFAPVDHRYLWKVAREGNGEAVPVTRLELHESAARALLTAYRVSP